MVSCWTGDDGFHIQIDGEPDEVRREMGALLFAWCETAGDTSRARRVVARQLQE